MPERAGEVRTDRHAHDSVVHGAGGVGRCPNSDVLSVRFAELSRDAGASSAHMSAPPQTRRSLAVPVLSVRTEDGRTFRFSRPFHIGRLPDCDVQIERRARQPQARNGVVRQRPLAVPRPAKRQRRVRRRPARGDRVHRIESDDPAGAGRPARDDGAGVARRSRQQPPPPAPAGRRNNDGRELRGTVLRHRDRRRAGGRPDADDPQGVPAAFKKNRNGSIGASSRSWRSPPSSPAATRTTDIARSRGSRPLRRSCSTR